MAFAATAATTTTIDVITLRITTTIACMSEYTYPSATDAYRMFRRCPVSCALPTPRTRRCARAAALACRLLTTAVARPGRLSVHRSHSPMEAAIRSVWLSRPTSCCRRYAGPCPPSAPTSVSPGRGAPCGCRSSSASAYPCSRRRLAAAQAVISIPLDLMWNKGGCTRTRSGTTPATPGPPTHLCPPEGAPCWPAAWVNTATFSFCAAAAPSARSGTTRGAVSHR